MINDGHYIDDPVDVVNAKPDFEGIGEMPANFKIKGVKIHIENSSYYKIQPIAAKVKINQAIAADLDRMVAHLARTHRVTQRHIIEIMEVYSQNKL